MTPLPFQCGHHIWKLENYFQSTGYSGTSLPSEWAVPIMYIIRSFLFAGYSFWIRTGNGIILSTLVVSEWCVWKRTLKNSISGPNPLNLWRFLSIFRNWDSLLRVTGNLITSRDAYHRNNEEREGEKRDGWKGPLLPDWKVSYTRRGCSKIVRGLTIPLNSLMSQCAPWTNCISHLGKKYSVEMVHNL